MLRTMIVIDTHVHLQAGQSAGTLLTAAAANLGALAPAGATRAIVLVERVGSDVFTPLARGPLPAEVRLVTVESSGKALCVRTRGGDDLWVLPGRQVVTAERLEVLLLGMASPLGDGVSAAEAITAAGRLGAVPVLPWAVGKWLGARGSLVASLMHRFADAGLLLADSALRPYGWPEPRVMRTAARLLAGTDPLPLAGDSERAGRYAVLLDAALDDSDPHGSLLAALRDSAVPCRRVGRRLWPVGVACRMLRWRHARHAGPVL
jgi:hypothetical protein